MLNGIGGRTIDEAKRSISTNELGVWAAYVTKRGSLNIGRRVEVALAPVSYAVHRFVGGKANFDEFIPHERPEPAAEEYATIDGLLAVLRAAKVRE